MIVAAKPEPMARPLLTPGAWVLLGLIACGLVVAAFRFTLGLEATTHLDQQHPWGLWIAIDVATGVALAAGGFTTAALVYVFGGHRFHPFVRPALLTALLGYTFVGLGLMADLGRYYNIWHPILPSMWQGNSVLFEVGMCVMGYLTVLYIEFVPVVCERFMHDPLRPRLAGICQTIHHHTHRYMFIFILAGVVLSCLHQSSLGNLMVLAPTKVHALWYTPIMALLFLLSAIAVGFPMVMVESLAASWTFRRRPEIHLLGGLAKLVPVTLGIYGLFKIGDLAIRGAWTHLMGGDFQSFAFMTEFLLGIVVPFCMLLSHRVRSSPAGLATAAFLVVLGVAINRVNVFVVAYQPPYATRAYVPSLTEIVVTVGLISGLIFLYRVIVTYFPVIAGMDEVEST